MAERGGRRPGGLGDKIFTANQTSGTGTKLKPKMGNGQGIAPPASKVTDFFSQGQGKRHRNLGNAIIGALREAHDDGRDCKVVTSQQLDHSWDQTDSSTNFKILEDGVTAQRLEGKGSTDAVRSKKAYQSGCHVFQIYWPKDEWGSHASIGCGTTEVPLTSPGYSVLIGSTVDSWGWNVCEKKLYHGGKECGTYPAGRWQLGDIFYMILNLQTGNLSFRTKGNKDLGIAFNNLPKGDTALCVMASATSGNCRIRMKYIGSEDILQMRSSQRKDTRSLQEPMQQTYYTFHSRCGKNTEVLFGGKMARRKEAEDEPDNGVVLTSQSLEDGEPFQVRLNSKVSRWRGSLEIGVTTTPADLLDFPSSMTDRTIGITYMWCGDVVYMNGDKILDLDRDLDNITVGDCIGLMVDGDKLYFYHNGCRLPQEVSGVPNVVYGVVDVYGDAECVTLVGTDRSLSRLSTIPGRKEIVHLSTPLSTMMAMRSTIDTLKNTEIESVTIATEIEITILKPYYASDGDRDLRMAYGDHLADLGAAQEFAKLLRKLSEGALSEGTNWQLEQTVRLACWNYSNVSVKVAVQIGMAGLVSIFLEDLDKYGIPKTKNEKQRFVVLSALNILHNCAKASENRQIYRDHQALGRISKYLKSDDREYVMVAALTLSYISEDDKLDLVEMDTRATKQILTVLKKGLESPDLYGRVDESGYSVLELTQGLSCLALNQTNKANLWECGALSLMMKTITKGGFMEKEHAADVVWRLAQHSDSVRTKIRNNTAAMETLTELMQCHSVPVQQAAERALLCIHQVMRQQHIGMPEKKNDALLTCDYRSLCKRFMDSLDLQAEFFNSKYDMCYCNSCHVTRADSLYYTRGEPAMVYGLPIGWCRFGLHIHKSRANALKVFQKWHVAYHGTTVGAIKNIIETGNLLLPGDVAYGGITLREGKGHFNDDWKPKGFDTKNVFLSPSIRYAGIECYARPKKFKDAQSGQKYTASVALQVCIRPNSYKVGKDTVGASQPFDPRIDNQNIEWFTKERGSIILYGLLVKLC
ncbi:neuralized-like protein 4 [Ptychodera flava]|uniref:neuralized-like protein 4 n=1 Tax=Ptychodera flava TaxID=63121 RepID=UPI003969CEF0